jgi:hypothetical protein
MEYEHAFKYNFIYVHIHALLKCIVIKIYETMYVHTQLIGYISQCTNNYTKPHNDTFLSSFVFPSL